jgi:hypothetical protein
MAQAPSSEQRGVAATGMGVSKPGDFSLATYDCAPQDASSSPKSTPSAPPSLMGTVPSSREAEESKERLDQIHDYSTSEDQERHLLMPQFGLTL